MEQEFENKEPEREGYVPRPKWQVWGARAVLVVFIALLVYYYIQLARGGL